MDGLMAHLGGDDKVLFYFRCFGITYAPWSMEMRDPVVSFRCSGHACIRDG
jgi:hypothetical protein